MKTPDLDLLIEYKLIFVIDYIDFIINLKIMKKKRSSYTFFSHLIVFPMLKKG